MPDDPGHHRFGRCTGGEQRLQLASPARPKNHDAMWRTNARWWAMLVVVLSGCTSGSDVPEGIQAIDTTAWCLTGSASVPLVFRIPPDLESVEQVYADRHEWTTTDQTQPIASLDFEITPEAGEPEPHLGVFRLLPFHTSPKRGYRRWDETIDGRRARLVTYSRYGRTVAIAKVPLDSTRWVQLTMVGQENLQTVKAALPAIARTLRFGPTFMLPEGSNDAAACPDTARSRTQRPPERQPPSPTSRTLHDT